MTPSVEVVAFPPDWIANDFRLIPVDDVPNAGYAWLPTSCSTSPVVVPIPVWVGCALPVVVNTVVVAPVSFRTNSCSFAPAFTVTVMLSVVAVVIDGSVTEIKINSILQTSLFFKKPIVEICLKPVSTLLDAPQCVSTTKNTFDLPINFNPFSPLHHLLLREIVRQEMGKN